MPTPQQARKRALELLEAGLTTDAPTPALPVPADLGHFAPVRPAAPLAEGIASDLPEPPTPDQELGALRAEADRRSLGAEIGRAGAMAGEAISGTPVRHDVFDRLGSRKEFESYLERRQKPLPASKASKSTDPNSPESKRAQVVVRSVLGDRFSDDEIAQMTEADADSVMKYGSMSAQRDVQLKGQLATSQRASAQLKQSAQQHAENLGYKWANMGQDLQLAFLRIEEERLKQTTSQTKDLGKEYTDGGFADFYKQHETAQAILDKHKGALPGTGLFSGRLPDRLVSEDAKTLRYATGQMLLAYRKSVTGTGSSAEEDRKISQATGLIQTNDDASIRKGMEIIKDVMDARAAALKAGYKPEAVETYEGRLPQRRAPKTPAKAPPPASSTQPPAAGDTVRVRRPDGKIGTIPRANLEAAKKRGAVEVQ